MSDHRPRIAKKDVERIYPLLPLQQGMLFHELYEPRARPYFRQMSFAIAGDFDPRLCQAAWNALIARHELLRSVFDYESTSHFLQLVLKEREVEFASEDLSRRDGSARRARVERYRAADRARGFDLRRDPLMRVQVFRLADRSFEMIWSHPHILLDGWSGSVLLAEFAEIYAALQDRRPWVLPVPPPYQAYLDEMAKYPPGSSLSYWTKQLEGYDSLASLPRQRGTRQGGDPRPRQHAFSLGAARTSALERLAARNSVTASTVMRAAWGIILARHNDTDDVVFGSVVSGRTVDVPEIERMVGLFINTVPVRVTIDPDASFVVLLARLQHFAVESMAHEHVSLAQIQAVSVLPKGLLDHLLVFENYPSEETHQAGSASQLGFRVTSVHTDEQANYDFGVLVHPGSPVQIAFTYDQNAYSVDQMGRLEGQLLALLDQVTDNDGTPVGRLDILPAAERDELSHKARGLAIGHPTDETLANLWNTQVAKTPERTALVFGSERLTYRELDDWANEVANDLTERLGVTLEEPVGVLAARGTGRIAALLGILKAGGAYVPLSPALPAERIRYMMEDTACRIVLTDAAGVARVEAIRPGLARLIGDRGMETARSPLLGAGARNLAYIIYTSGSTGRPKGVLVEHRGFVNMIREQIRGFWITDQDRVLQFASCSFDASLSEVFMALLTGASLVLVDEETTRDGHRLQAYMRERQVSVVTLPPSYLRALERADFPGLRVLITAGEPPDERDARHYAARLQYFNAYGPTEVSVCASFHEVRADAEYPEGIPIGQPLANTVIRILDKAGRPMPFGAPGEICIAGRGLARGYRNSPELTGQKFVASPFDGDGRLYRTGDAGALLGDGNILFLGRRDGQVKLHGHRIELGEVESVLRDYRGIRDAAVVVHGKRGERQCIAAYVVAAEMPDLAAVRRHLSDVLPSYMVPAIVIRLPALPRTIAGKLDRNALPVPEDFAPPGNVAPRNADELAVATAFEEVLGRPGVGAQDSFSALGGDSLTAIKVANRLRRRGFHLDLRDLLRLDTVAAIAVAMSEAAPDDRAATGPLPLTPIQRWFFDEHCDGLNHLNHAVLLRAAQPLQEAPLRAAIEAIWRHHDALRLRCRFESEAVTQEIADPSHPVDFRIVDLRPAADPWSSLVADANRLHRSLDLETGPLMKAVWYRLPEEDHLLLLAHHLVVDAVSWRFLLEDVMSGYRQAQDGRAVRLPAKTASYQDWARLLVAHSRSDALLSEKPYWRRVHCAPTKPLPTDSAPIAHRYDETSTMELEATLPARLSEAVVQAALLAAVARALAAWDGRQATRIVLAGHGRVSPDPGVDVSRTVGWFTAEFPFLLGNAGSADIVGHIREIERQLAEIPMRGLGHGILRWLTPRELVADLTFSPRPELSVNYLGRMDESPGDGFSICERLPSTSVGRLERTSLLEIEAMLGGAGLAVAMRYCPAVHHEKTIGRLRARLQTELTAAFDAVGARHSAGALQCT